MELLTAQAFRERIFDYTKEETWSFKGENNVMIDFYADWCAPCKMISPIVDEISADFVGKLSVGKLDADANRETVSELGVRNIPTLLLYKNGEQVDKLVGAVTKQKLADMINNQLVGA